MTTVEIQALIKEVVVIARNAGLKIMEVYQDVDNFNIEVKDDNSPLTRADREANTIICDGLEKLEVKFPIISEENKSIPYEERKNFEYVWMVDPLDGTKEFIKRNGEFTVNIALIHDNKSVAGVVYAPAKNEMYYAVKGSGAFRVTDSGDEKLKVNSYSNADRGLRIVCSRSHLNDATQAFIDQFDQPEKVSTGSSLKFLIIANGNAEIYPRLAPTMEWDTAAAQIILEEAGGAVYQAKSKQPVKYNKEDLLNPQFIATAAQSH